jgi:hypothetical protein
MNKVSSIVVSTLASVDPVADIRFAALTGGSAAAAGRLADTAQFRTRFRSRRLARFSVRRLLGGLRSNQHRRLAEVPYKVTGRR